MGPKRIEIILRGDPGIGKSRLAGFLFQLLQTLGYKVSADWSVDTESQAKIDTEGVELHIETRND